jgi:tetratricopeptide repeat protein 8
MENYALALSRFRRNRLDDCIVLCDSILKAHPNDLAVQILKTHAIRRKNYLDDLELDDEGFGEILLDDNKISNAPRPGTSVQRLGTQKNISQLVRPMSSSGRPLSGVVRPGSQQRIGTSNQNRLQTAMNNRVGTSRATTSGGRYLRIATASLQSLNSSMQLDLNSIEPKKLIRDKSKAKVK